jgi:poly-gamma-glutamate synthesis protein (capsule biosynthesis protein)
MRPRGSLLTLGALLLGSFACTSSSTEAKVLDAGAGPSAPASAPSTSPVAPALASSPSPPIPAPVTILISAVGDCTLGGDVHRASELSPFDAVIAAHGGDLRYPFSGVRALLESDDVTIANLEGTLTTSYEPSDDVPFHFRGKPAYAEILREGSVEVVNLANNHSHDFGGRGYQDTLRALRAAGIGAAGYSLVDTRTVKGVEVHNLGFTGGDPVMLARVRSAVTARKAPGNLVIVSFHWGLEGKTEVIDVQRALGRAAIDAGADLVLGTHPHVIQGIETYRGRRIVYSLGNFVFGGNVNPTDKEAIVYRASFTVADGRIAPSGEEIVPVRITTAPERNDFRPVVLAGEARDRALARVATSSEGLDGAKIRSKALRPR